MYVGSGFLFKPLKTSGFGMCDWEESATLLPMFVKALANHSLDPSSLWESLTSHVSECLFMLKVDSIDQIQDRELNYLISLFDNDL